MQHIKDQNWFAVGLDVIVVIAGIFLGMQVQQWYEGRQELEQEREILYLLVNESIQRINYFESRIAYIDTKIASQEASIQALIDGKLPDSMTNDDFVEGVTITRMLASPSPPNAIYDSIIATGEIRLLRNKTLVQALANFQSRLTGAREYAMRLAMSKPAQSDYHPAIQSIYDPSLPGKRRQYAQFDDLVGDPAFLRQSIDILRMVSALQLRRNELLDDAQSLHQLICNESSEDC